MISEFAKEKVFWTRKMNLRLVKFIESRPNIWNPKHPKYTSLDFRDQTYAEFASKYGNEFTGQAVRYRWTNIRCTFANCLRKLKASREKADAEEYKINWPLWDPCQFLLKVNRKLKAETSREQFDDDDENGDLSADNKEEWSSDGERIPEASETEINGSCQDIANSLMEVFKGVQNDAFGLDNTKHGRIGRTVTKRLTQMNSYDAARCSTKIMEILLLYDESNPANPNNIKSDST